MVREARYTLVCLNDLRWANQRATRVSTVTYEIKALVDATESSRPQFKKTPH